MQSLRALQTEPYLTNIHTCAHALAHTHNLYTAHAETLPISIFPDCQGEGLPSPAVIQSPGFTDL